jgi:hypothetical protein
MATIAPLQPTQATDITDKLPPEIKDKVEELRALFAEGNEIGLKALDRLIAKGGQTGGQIGQEPPAPITNAGRIGLRQGKVSELTVIAPFAEGGAKRLRALLKALGANFGAAGDKVGTLHDMRFVFFDNDTRMLFCTATTTPSRSGRYSRKVMRRAFFVFEGGSTILKIFCAPRSGRSGFSIPIEG